MLLPACKLLVVGRFAKGEGFFWLDDLDGIRLARRESLAVLLKKRRACPAMKRVVDVCYCKDKDSAFYVPKKVGCQSVSVAKKNWKEISKK